MSRIVFDPPAWWQRAGWQIGVAALLALVALVVWWSALVPVDHGPIVVRTPAPTVMARSAVAPATPTAQAAPPVAPTVPSPAPQPPPPLSTMVAPGVHVTPLGLPPGAMAVPAQPQTEENLEN